VKEEALEYLERGGKYYSDGDYRKAARYYEMAIETMPELADAHFNLGITYEKLNRYEAAVKSYRKSISLNPENAHAFYNIGVIR
jgi:tetratricopeptide (TPR) repeat protein